MKQKVALKPQILFSSIKWSILSRPVLDLLGQWGMNHTSCTTAAILLWQSQIKSKALFLFKYCQPAGKDDGWVRKEPYHLPNLSYKCYQSDEEPDRWSTYCACFPHKYCHSQGQRGQTGVGGIRLFTQSTEFFLMCFTKTVWVLAIGKWLPFTGQAKAGKQDS